MSTFKQSTSKRGEIVSKESQVKPGPGSYANGYKTVGKDVPSFTMGKKSSQPVASKNPGPG